LSRGRAHTATSTAATAAKTRPSHLTSNVRASVATSSVYAHNNPRSFCHGVLERFTEGLRHAGHASEVTDLYAIKFDPVFRDRDVASYITDDIPADILELMDLPAQVMSSCRGPIQRRLAAGRCAAKPRPASPP
jgi:hypothetical protein